MSPPRSIGPASKKKKKTSVRKFLAKSRASSGSKQSMTGLVPCLDKDLGAASGSGQGPASPVLRSPMLRSPASTAHKGRRVRESGESVAARAERRAAARDLPASGTSTHLFPPSSPIRLVLPALSDDHLLHILSDVGVAVDPGLGSPSRFLSVIRANEVAQAAIAKAKEAAASVGIVATQGPVGDHGEADGCGQSPPPPTQAKRGPAKHSKSCLAPCRSSLRIKNLSYK